jgi:hypothetical protein
MIRTDREGGWKIYRKSDPEKKTPEYKAWVRINALCAGKSSKHNQRYYHERGIKVFEDWKFVRGDNEGNKLRYNNFLAFIGRKPEGNVVLGRVDKSSGFIPHNVKWMDTKEQQRGKGVYCKFSYSRDEELIAELERRGYEVVSH